jgi:hypothetical protein
VSAQIEWVEISGTRYESQDGRIVIEQDSYGWWQWRRTDRSEIGMQRTLQAAKEQAEKENG